LCLVALIFWGDIGFSTDRELIGLLRLPKVLTTFSIGLLLSVSGFFMQAIFKEPMAGPDLFGIQSGASVSVAVASLYFGLQDFGLYSFLGAVAVSILLMILFQFFYQRTLLIVSGLMISALLNSVISIVLYRAHPEAIKNYLLWGQGSFRQLDFHHALFYFVLTLISMVPVLWLYKKSKLLFLGRDFALLAGLNEKKFFWIFVAMNSLWVTLVLKIAGPIGFIGVMAPNMVRVLAPTISYREKFFSTLVLGIILAMMTEVMISLFFDGDFNPNVILGLFSIPFFIYLFAGKFRRVHD